MRNSSPGSRRGTFSDSKAPVRLRVVDAKGFEKIVRLRMDLLRVGSDAGNDLCLDHPSIAPCHLLIIREGRRFVLMDTSAGQTTRLNGSPVVKKELTSGDVITLGPGCPYKLEFLTQGIRADDGMQMRLRALLDASKAISSSLVLDEVLDRIVDAVMTITQAEKGFLALVESDGTLKSCVARNIEPDALHEEIIPASRSVIREAIASRRSVFRTGEGGTPSASITRLRLKTIMCVPIMLEGRVIGVMYVDHRSAVASMGRVDLEVLESLADHAALAIDNARLTERMLLAERLSAVGRMVSSIVHDLRKPMTSIKAVAQLLQTNLRTPKAPRLAGTIISEVDRMSEMASEMLDFCRGRMIFSSASCRLSTFLTEFAERVRDEMRSRSIDLVLDVRDDVTVRIDRNRLDRAFHNLLDNAADAMPEGGRITIRSVLAGDCVRIGVTDTGRGMTQDVRDRLFEPFFTSGKANGTGLGMPIVRRIIEAHGGRIAIRSTPGVGTTVVIALPVDRDRQSRSLHRAGIGSPEQAEMDLEAEKA
ncbi:MAG: ATP-binding protein, partial [Acidobacteriota bacterium]